MAIQFVEYHKNPKVKEESDDIKIKVGDVTLYADSHVLKHFEYFRKMLCGEWKESKLHKIEITDFDVKTVELFLKTTHEGCHVTDDMFTNSELFDLMILMDKYGISIKSLIVMLDKKIDKMAEKLGECEYDTTFDLTLFNDILTIMNNLRKLPFADHYNEIETMIKKIHICVVMGFVRCRVPLKGNEFVDKYIMSEECDTMNIKIVGETNGLDRKGIYTNYRYDSVRKWISYCYLFSCCMGKDYPASFHNMILEYIKLNNCTIYTSDIASFCKRREITINVNLVAYILWICIDSNRDCAKELLSDEDFKYMTTVLIDQILSKKSDKK